MADPLYTGTTMTVIIKKVTDALGVVVTGATVTMDVLDANGSVIAGGDDLTFTEPIAGEYHGDIPSSVIPVLDAKGEIEVTMLSGGKDTTLYLPYVVWKKIRG